MGTPADENSLLRTAKEWVNIVAATGQRPIWAWSAAWTPRHRRCPPGKDFQGGQPLDRAVPRSRGRKVYWAIAEGIVQPAEFGLPTGSSPAAIGEMMLIGPTIAGAGGGDLKLSPARNRPARQPPRGAIGDRQKTSDRIQLADRGHPIVGDYKYGGPEEVPTGNRPARPADRVPPPGQDEQWSSKRAPAGMGGMGRDRVTGNQ